MTQDRSFIAFCWEQRQRLRQKLNGSVARVQRARRIPLHELHEEWTIHRPASIGYGMGGCRPSLEDYDEA
jgi:hypothetical protein